MVGRALKLAAVAASALALVAVVAVVRIPSHISIHSHGLTFSGRVTSPNTACEAHRRVTLHRTNGNILGHATTNSVGHWKITASGSAGISLGHFFATVRRRAEGTAGTIFVCKRAVSRTIPFHQ